jgi:HK97 family phage major capsid protein
MREGTLTADEQREIARSVRDRREPETRGAIAGNGKRAGEIQGVPGEILKPGQSLAEWHRRAAENGVEGVRRAGTDIDWNAYWAQRAGLARPGAEMRALGEDTASGAGAAQAIVPQEWSTTFVDLLRAKLVLSQAGMSTLPMTTEKYNLPQWMADVAPAYVAENAATTLDANPQFSTVLFSCPGAYLDVTLVSRQAMEDTNQQGGLAAMLQDVISAKYARLIEQVAFYGTATNAGNPGLVNESGLVITWNATNGAAPTDTTPFSLAAETVRNANSEPTAYITNPAVRGTFARLNASSVARYWGMPDDVADIPVLDTTAIASNETHGTGTNLSSFYAGPWHRMIMGQRINLQVDVLRERYADMAQIGLVSYMRFSIRTTHPEAFVKYGGFITT